MSSEPNMAPKKLVVELQNLRWADLLDYEFLEVFKVGNNVLQII